MLSCRIRAIEDARLSKISEKNIKESNCIPFEKRLKAVFLFFLCFDFSMKCKQGAIWFTKPRKSLKISRKDGEKRCQVEWGMNGESLSSFRVSLRVKSHIVTGDHFSKEKETCIHEGLEYFFLDERERIKLHRMDNKKAVNLKHVCWCVLLINSETKGEVRWTPSINTFRDRAHGESKNGWVGICYFAKLVADDILLPKHNNILTMNGKRNLVCHACQATKSKMILFLHWMVID